MNIESLKSHLKSRWPSVVGVETKDNAVGRPISVGRDSGMYQVGEKRITFVWNEIPSVSSETGRPVTNWMLASYLAESIYDMRAMPSFDVKIDAPYWGNGEVPQYSIDLTLAYPMAVARLGYVTVTSESIVGKREWLIEKGFVDVVNKYPDAKRALSAIPAYIDLRSKMKMSSAVNLWLCSIATVAIELDCQRIVTDSYGFESKEKAAAFSGYLNDIRVSYKPEKAKPYAVHATNVLRASHTVSKDMTLVRVSECEVCNGFMACKCKDKTFLCLGCMARKYRVGHEEHCHKCSVTGGKWKEKANDA